jgi:hypothetical protein
VDIIECIKACQHICLIYGIEKEILKFVIVLLEKRAKTEFLGCKL